MNEHDHDNTGNPVYRDADGNPVPAGQQHQQQNPQNPQQQNQNPQNPNAPDQPRFPAQSQRDAAHPTHPDHPDHPKDDASFASAYKSRMAKYANLAKLAAELGVEVRVPREDDGLVKPTVLPTDGLTAEQKAKNAQVIADRERGWQERDNQAKAAGQVSTSGGQYTPGTTSPDDGSIEANRRRQAGGQ